MGVKLRRLSGGGEEARIINQIIDELERLQLRAGPGVKIMVTSNGTTISADAKEQKAGSDTGVWLP